MRGKAHHGRESRAGAHLDVAVAAAAVQHLMTTKWGQPAMEGVRSTEGREGGREAGEGCKHKRTLTNTTQHHHVGLWTCYAAETRAVDWRDEQWGRCCVALQLQERRQGRLVRQGSCEPR